MLKLCILYLFVLILSALEVKTDDPTETTVGTTINNSAKINSEEDQKKVDNLAIANSSRENETLKGVVDAIGDKLNVNGTANTTAVEDLLENSNKSEIINGTVETSVINGTANKIEGLVGDVTEADKETTKDKLNETFIARVEKVVKRLFKREVVGSLVRRDSTELRENPKITVPMFYQSEYYQLRLRKQEIERNKNTFKDQNRTVYEDLIQETWEKLVNWSRDHLAFEDKIIKIHNLKTHAHIQNTKEVDSDATEDSEDKLRSIDSDEDSDKSMKPEFATVKNLAEVNERYGLEKNIEEIERKIKSDPKENNEKHRLLLAQYRHDLKMIDLKYERIREMKLNRKFVEEVWREKNLIDRKNKEEPDDDDL